MSSEDRFDQRDDSDERFSLSRRPFMSGLAGLGAAGVAGIAGAQEDGYYGTLVSDLTEMGLPEPSFVYADNESDTWDAYQFGGTEEFANVSGLDVEDRPFGHASRVEIPEETDNDYDVNLRADVSDSAAAEGDVLLGVAYLRAPEGEAEVNYHARYAAEYSNEVASDSQPTFGSEWERYYFPIEYGTGADAGDWWTEFWLAYGTQTVDVGGLALLDYSDTDVAVGDLPSGAASQAEAGGGDDSGGSNEGPDAWPEVEDAYYSSLIDELDGMDLGPGEFVYADNPADTLSTYTLGGTTEAAERSSLDVSDADVPFDEAARLDVTEEVENNYSVNFLGTVADRAVQSGDVLLGVAYLRTPDEESAQVTYKASETDNVAQNYVTKGAPSVGSEWERYYFPVEFGVDGEPGDWWTEIWLGAKVQTVDVGGLALIDFGGNDDVGDLPVWEESPADDWEEQADQRIEENRTSELTVSAVDESGDPIEGADVSVSMVEHEFRFGTMVNAPHLVENTEEGDPYREHRKELFNTGVLENYHKWAFWERGQDSADAAVDWMEDQDWYVRGHVALWASIDSAAVPDDVVDAMGWDDDAGEVVPSEADSEYVRTETTAHVEDIIGYYGDRIDEWEVINELTHVPGFVRAIHGDDVNPVEAPVLDEWFGTAREAGPDGQPLGINDYNTLVGPYSGTRDQYETQIQYVRDTDAGLDFAGVQSHFSQSSALLPSEVMQGLDRYADDDVRLRITEFDMSDDTWPEADKADFFYQFLKTVYSHPAVDQFLVWGINDELHWRDDAVFFSAGWEEKPALDRYRDLVFDQWWTEESGTTGADGQFAATGHHGEYEVTVSTDDAETTATATLSAGGDSVEVQVGGDGGSATATDTDDGTNGTDTATDSGTDGTDTATDAGMGGTGTATDDGAGGAGTDADTTSGDGPGLGVLTALTGLAGAGALSRFRGDGDDSEA
ncbi:endo-1,4-beta-xylanase [Halosimplex salinum]|uniref:endo-1,4-beta-xylanase n=1 Tax=Halosimplex salinum TaxID=1710538 RepID=UPI000F467C04|nr:endo-1,4-beta-xylanase [Halosimplex salinum]